MKNSQLTAMLGATLFVSLSINIFMAGTVIGSAAHKAAYDTAAQDRQLKETLPDADKAVLKQAMDASRPEITRLYDELEKIKQNIREIIKKDPVDEKALGAALEAEKNKKLKLLWLAHETRQAAVEKMSPEGRAILSKMNHLGFDLSTQCR